MRLARNPLLTIAVALCPLAGFGEEHVRNTSYTAAWGERVLRQVAVINAPLENVWNAFTTSEGLKTFMAPTVELERRTGGKFHSNYKYGSKVGDPGTIYNTVLNYLPLQMFSIKIGLNEVFPKDVRETDTLFCVLQFEAVDADKSQVTVSMLGFGQGPGWDWTYRFFDQGNAYTLEQLYQRFEHGPVDWSTRKALQIHSDSSSGIKEPK